MRKFDYSFLNNGLLTASLVSLTANLSALKTMGTAYRWMRPEPSPPASFSTSETLTML